MNNNLDRLHDFNSKILDRRFNQDGPMCCFCIPMNIGIILIAIFMAFDTFTFATMAYRMDDLSYLVQIFYIVTLLPCIIALGIFIRYFFKDT